MRLRIQQISGGSGWYLVKQPETFGDLMKRIFITPSKIDWDIMRENNAHLGNVQMMTLLQVGQVVIVALELAPTMNYGNSLDTKQWLRVRNANGSEVRLPQGGDPYEDIYKSDKWYGLVPHYAPDDTAAGGNSRINPAGLDLGMPDREYFIKNIESAQFFHKVYMPHSYYHPKSYASYLAQGKAFETVTWVATGGTQYNPVGSEMGGVWTTESGSPIHTETELDAGELSPITSTNVDDYDLTEDGGRGNIGIRQGNRTQRYKVLGQDKGKGDGTVPRDSGEAPKPFVQAIFEQGHGVVNDHQESWTVPAAQRMALLAIAKFIKDDKRAE